jgi:hypothetical protein
LEYGYDYKTAMKVWKQMENAYFKCRKFIGDKDDILEIVNELRERWG